MLPSGRQDDVQRASHHRAGQGHVVPLPTGCLSGPGPRRPRAAGTFDGASGRAVTDQSLRPLQPHRTRQSLICQAVESQAGASARAEGTTSAGCPPGRKRASSPEGTGSPSLSFNLANSSLPRKNPD